MLPENFTVTDQTKLEELHKNVEKLLSLFAQKEVLMDKLILCFHQKKKADLLVIRELKKDLQRIQTRLAYRYPEHHEF